MCVGHLRNVSLAAVALVGCWQPAWAISVGFFDLGAGMVPSDVSTNGTLVGGEDANGDAFLWTEEHGMQSIGGDFRGIDWYADDGYYSGVTTNAVIIAGQDTDEHPRVWFGNADGSQDGTAGWHRLPLEGGSNPTVAIALGVAQDSSNFWVGGYENAPSRQAVRYKHSSLSNTAIGGPPGGGDLAQFDGASDTGVFAGRQRDNSNGGKRRGRYQSDWLESLFVTEGEANNISMDGSVAVGWDSNEPVWWDTSSGTLNAIPLLPGDTSGEATAANEDGSIIVGWSDDGTTRQNWIWDATNGTRELGTFLASAGIAVPSGFNFDEQGNRVLIISGGGYDDLTIVGNGDRTTPRGYVVHLGPATPGDFDGDGDVDGDDFLVWQRNFGGPGPDGDADDDGDVDGDDFLIWQSNFGPGAAAGNGAVNAVPEPSSALLVLVAVWGLAMLTRRSPRA